MSRETIGSLVPASHHSKDSKWTMWVKGDNLRCCRISDSLSPLRKLNRAY